MCKFIPQWWSEDRVLVYQFVAFPILGTLTAHCTTSSAFEQLRLKHKQTCILAEICTEASSNRLCRKPEHVRAKQCSCCVVCEHRDQCLHTLAENEVPSVQHPKCWLFSKIQNGLNQHVQSWYQDLCAPLQNPRWNHVMAKCAVFIQAC